MLFRSAQGRPLRSYAPPAAHPARTLRSYGIAARSGLHGARPSGRDAARAVEERLLRARRDVDADAVADRAAASGRRDLPAGVARLRRHHGVDLPEELERLEPGDHDSIDDHRDRRRMAARGGADRGAYSTGGRHHRGPVRTAAMAAHAVREPHAEAEHVHRRSLRGDRRLHHDAGECRGTGVADASAAARTRQAHLRRHGHDPVRGLERAEDPGVREPRLSDRRQPAARVRAAAGRGRGELRRDLAGAKDVAGDVLPDRVCADVLHRAGIDTRVGDRTVGAVVLDRMTPCAKSGGAFEVWAIKGGVILHDSKLDVKF